MNDFNQSNRYGSGGGSRRFSGRDLGRRNFGDRNSPRSMHRARCAQCGNECEVPFRPSGDRPVYCSNCFEKRSNADGNLRDSDRRDQRKPRFEEKPNSQLSEQILEQLRNLNSKLDKIISVIEPSAIEPKVVEPVVLEPKAKKPKASKKKVSEEQVRTIRF